MNSLALSLVVAFYLITFVNGQISSFFSKEDISTFDNNNNLLLTASDVYHYLNILSGFKLDTSKVCKQECNSIIKNSLISSATVYDYYNIYYAAASSKICQCSGLEIPASVKNSLKETSIDSLNTVREISGVVLAADLLEVVSPNLLEQSAIRLKKFLSPDGTFKETITSSSGTTQGLTYALDALVVLYKTNTQKKFRQ